METDPQKDITELKRAVDLIFETFDVNNIGISVGISALNYAIACTCSRATSFEDYCDILNLSKKQFKYLWNENNGK